MWSTYSRPKDTTIVAISRSNGVDVISRDGLAEALTGVECVIDAATGPSPDQEAANKYPDWEQEVAARSALRLGFYRPGRPASRVRCPLLVLAYDDDRSALPGPAARAAQRAPRGELVRLPGGHYQGVLCGHEQGEIQLSFLRRHLLDGAQASAAQAPASAAAAR